ncbi:ArsR/SmtB family transcription factor [Actinopolymorpha pittospori]
MLDYRGSPDRLFHALADPHRRAVVERLTHGPASVSELAAPLPMSLAAVVQHLKVLTDCGLVRSEKAGRVRTCHLEPAGLRMAEEWLRGQRTAWENRLDRLGALLAEEADAEEADAEDADSAEDSTRRDEE